MKKSALKLLTEIKKAGHEAYIVGGFVRDYYLKRSSTDIDICTSATPQQLKKLFPQSVMPQKKYGSVILHFHKVRFEITTFRKENKYDNYRHPISVEYIKDIKKDLLRRDFTINALCMNNEGSIVDYLNVKKDLDKKIIKTIKSPYITFQEDALRILRAIRFAIALGFSLDEKLIKAINREKKGLKNISYQRKKNELDKIFSNINAARGLKMLKELNLAKYLDIKLNGVIVTNDIIGIWSQIVDVEKYPFTKNEARIIKQVRAMVKSNNFSLYNIYKNGLYVSGIAAEICGLSKKEIIKKHRQLAIQSVKDIKITADEIANYCDNKKEIKIIYADLEEKIINRLLKNHPQEIKKYLNRKFLN